MQDLEESLNQKIAEYSAMLKKQIKTAEKLINNNGATLLSSSDNIVWYKYSEFKIERVEFISTWSVPSFGIRFKYWRDGKQQDGLLNLNSKFIVHKQINVLDTILTQVIEIN